MASALRKARRYLSAVAKEHPKTRGIIRFSMNAYRLVRYKAGTFYIRSDEKVILFASFGGESYSDSPKALFEYMVKSGEFTDYTFVWGFKKRIAGHRKRLESLLEPDGQGTEETDGSESANEESLLSDAERPQIIVVKYGGKQWRKYTAEAGTWILNYKVPEYLKPKRNQVFLQTWHGTPLKRLGFDLEHFDNALNTAEGMKKRYGIETKKFDYFISPSPYASDRFRSAWRMDDYGKGDIIVEEGYPRNDILFTYTPEMIEKIKIRIFGYYYIPYEKYLKKKRLVLYAPTYRSNQHESGVGYVYKEEVDFEKMQRKLGEDFIILFRAHYFVANSFDFSRYPGFVYNVSKVEDINDLYLISDLLVTDYSSSMFDFANLKRPMIFHMYDLEHYRDESNGFYFDPEEELPGPIVRTDDELIAAIKDAAENFTYDEKYRRFNEKFDPLDDGQVCGRVINKLFKKGA